MACRFIYQNLITEASMLSASSIATGLVSAPLKEGSGSAILIPSGSYSGTEDREYIVEIDTVGGGAEVGQATFKWHNGTDWQDSVVLTATTNITLENGVQIKFTSGAGDDFTIGDRWYFKGITPFGLGQSLLLDRDVRYRSLTLDAPNIITIDLGSAKEVKALVLYDHNISSGATITLEANSVDVWSAPPLSVSLTWNVEKLVYFLAAAQTYRYWRLVVSDAANPDSHIEIGSLFLADYLQPSRSFAWKFTRGLAGVMAKTKAKTGLRKRRLYNLKNTFGYNFSLLDDGDISDLQVMLRAISDTDSGTIDPLFRTPDDSDPNNTFLVDVEALSWKQSGDNINSMKFNPVEVLKSV